MVYYNETFLFRVSIIAQMAFFAFVTNVQNAKTFWCDHCKK